MIALAICANRKFQWRIFRELFLCVGFCVAENACRHLILDSHKRKIGKEKKDA